MKKKLTAIIITLTMTLSCFVPVYAASPDDSRTDLVAAADEDTESADISVVEELPEDIADGPGESYEEEVPETEAADPTEDEAQEMDEDATLGLLGTCDQQGGREHPGYRQK